MHLRSSKPNWTACILLSIAALVALIWSFTPGMDEAWDLRVYRNAIAAMRSGQDPYVAGMAVQNEFHRTLAEHPNAVPPYTYVYSPLTLPVLRAAGSLPSWLSGSVYWGLYVAGIVTILLFGWRMVEPEERRVFIAVVAASLFFPGLLLQCVFLSGNVAFIVYGAVLGAALYAWKTGRWALFYLAVLLASCTKAPFLSLLAIPVLTARRQWLSACAAGVVGTAIFALQPQVWPELFRHYLQAVELQFSYNHDFGISPAGQLADALYYSVPYQWTSLVFYAFYAVLFGAVLFYLSRQFLQGRIPFRRWVPVMMLGVILLNPRIMEYDVVPITILMALVLWRVLRLFFDGPIAAGCGLTVLVVLNLVSMAVWRTVECCLLSAVFMSGCGALLWDAHRKRVQASGLEVGLRSVAYRGAGVDDGNPA